MVTADKIVMTEATTPYDRDRQERRFRGEVRLRCDFTVSDEFVKTAGETLAKHVAEDKIRHEIMVGLYGELAEVHGILFRTIAMLRPPTTYVGAPSPADEALATLKAHVDAMYLPAAPAAPTEPESVA